MTNKEITSIDDLFTIIRYMIAPTEFRIEPVRTMFGTYEPDYVRDIAGITVSGRRHEVNIYGGKSYARKPTNSRTELLKRICDEIGESTDYLDYWTALRSFVDSGAVNTRYCTLLCVDNAYNPFSGQLAHRLLYYAPPDRVVIYASEDKLQRDFDVHLNLSEFA